MHLITDEEYRAYIELTKVVRDYLFLYGDGACDLEAFSKALDKVVAAHNKRLNSLKRVHGT